MIARCHHSCSRPSYSADSAKEVAWGACQNWLWETIQAPLSLFIARLFSSCIGCAGQTVAANVIAVVVAVIAVSVGIISY